jgi:hypothetical protein
MWTTALKQAGGTRRYSLLSFAGEMPYSVCVVRASIKIICFLLYYFPSLVTLLFLQKR